jgi:hypothetical protein
LRQCGQWQWLEVLAVSGLWESTDFGSVGFAGDRLVTGW